MTDSARKADAGARAYGVKLCQALSRTDRWLRQLEDPQAGAIGEELRHAFNRVAAREVVDPSLRVNAVFRGFVWPPNKGQPGFQNTIAYSTEVLMDLGRLFGARTHEYIHALQYSRSAAMNADPFNPASLVALGPLAYVQRKERLEQDAYVKSAWLQSLLARKYPERSKALDQTPMGVAEFNKIRAACHGDLSVALGRAADEAARASGRWLHAGTPHPVRDLWHHQALCEYESILAARQRAGKMPQRYARMDLQDIQSIGATLGLNTFADAERATALPRLSRENFQYLRRIERRFGIPAHELQPTLSEALSDKGQTPRRFIRQSRHYRGP